MNQLAPAPIAPTTFPAAPTSTGEAAAALQPAQVRSERKPALPALTGVRTLLALTILLFHFTPSGLRWEAHPWLSLYPLIDIGYVFVSFFFLISGFILAYNYACGPSHAAEPRRLLRMAHVFRGCIRSTC